MVVFNPNMAIFAHDTRGGRFQPKSGLNRFDTGTNAIWVECTLPRTAEFAVAWLHEHIASAQQC